MLPLVTPPAVGVAIVRAAGGRMEAPMFTNEHQCDDGDPTVALTDVDLPFAWPLRQDDAGTWWAVVTLTSGRRYLSLREERGRLVPAASYATSVVPSGLRRVS